ncbi:MAG: hypothetical protein RLZZ245_1192, partial [Verrucomicrobiota bacterium]
YGGDLTYEIETSTDLGITDDWEPVISNVTANDTLIRYEFTLGSPVKSFIRLKVAQVP